MSQPEADPLTDVERVLIDGDLEIRGRIMPASNATFVGSIGDITVVYKPIRGENPLWDFPDGTLAQRLGRAAPVVSPNRPR